MVIRTVVTACEAFHPLLCVTGCDSTVVSFWTWRIAAALTTKTPTTKALMTKKAWFEARARYMAVDVKGIVSKNEFLPEMPKIRQQQSVNSTAP